MKTYSQAYVECLKHGPFSGHIDPWVEAAHYFHQIHGGMIDHLLGQIQDLLLGMGYFAGREASLQILQGRQPDVFIQGKTWAELDRVISWDYETAAVELLAEPGIVAESAELFAIHVKESSSGNLVTVVEIVSPSNKMDADDMAQYQDRRARLVLNQAVNVVEVDLTRSVKRLFKHPHTTGHHYHTALHLVGRWPRVVLSDFGEALKRVAVPLQEHAVAVDLQAAYDQAYRRAAIATHIHTANHYTAAELPFPSLLTDEQRQAALGAVADWQRRLAQLETA
jgi:hypothetical protein